MLPELPLDFTQCSGTVELLLCVLSAFNEMAAAATNFFFFWQSRNHKEENGQWVIFLFTERPPQTFMLYQKSK